MENRGVLRAFLGSDSGKRGLNWAWIGGGGDDVHSHGFSSASYFGSPRYIRGPATIRCTSGLVTGIFSERERGRVSADIGGGVFP